MNRKQKEKWELIRKKGREHYILYWGVILYGVLGAIITILIGTSLEYLFFNSHWEINYFMIVYILIIFPIIGLFVGIYNWREMEKQYLNILYH